MVSWFYAKEFLKFSKAYFTNVPQQKYLSCLYSFQCVFHGDSKFSNKTQHFWLFLQIWWQFSCVVCLRMKSVKIHRQSLGREKGGLPTWPWLTLSHRKSRWNNNKSQAFFASGWTLNLLSLPYDCLSCPYDSRLLQWLYDSTLTPRDPNKFLSSLRNTQVYSVNTERTLGYIVRSFLTRPICNGFWWAFAHA